MSDYVKGYLVLLLVIVVISMDSIAIRFTGLDGMSVAFWRNGGIALFMMLLAIMSYGVGGVINHLKAMTQSQCLSCLLFGVSGTFFSMAIQETSVVNVLMMFVLSPLLAVFMSAIFLKERINNVVKFTSIFVVLGTFWAYKDSFDTGADLGIFFAFVFVVANSGMSIVGRSLKTVPSSIIIMLGCGFWAILLAFTSPVMPDGVVATVSMFANVIMISVAYWGIVYSSRFVSAPEVNLMVITETVLGSLAAWVFLQEIPSSSNIIGGGVAFIAIVLNLSYSVYRQKKKTSVNI